MHVIRTLATGGTENIVRRLLSGLDPQLFEQKVCTLVSSPDCPAGTICLNCGLNKFEFLVPRLAGLLTREKPDIVHSRNWGTIEAIAAARLCATPAVVHSEHGRDLQTLGRQPLRRRMARRLLYGMADRVFCVSQELRNHYCQELNWGANVFEVIPNGVDVDYFCPTSDYRKEVRARLLAHDKTLVLGSVGRLDPVKDHVTLLRAAEMALAKGVDVRLVIVGDGALRPTLENRLAQIPQLAARTFLTGDVRNVAYWLNGFDIFVQCSLSEGMSNTLLEAMSVGVSPIVTEVGGNTEIVERDRSGLLVPPQDPERICSYLLQLNADESRRKQLGRNARQRVVSSFNLGRMLKQYTTMYCDLLESTKKGIPALSRA